MTWTHTYPRGVVHDMHVDDPDFRPSWTHGVPILIVNHFTVTCDREFPATGRFGDGIGPAFGIRRDGTVLQYVDLDRSTWHARDCSHRGVGIEYDADPGGDREPPGSSKCPIQVVQLEAGADLNAWLCDTFDIPAVRSPGIAFDPGIKCHTDGLEDGGDAWDSAHHWDAPWQAKGDPIEDWISAGQAATLNTSPWTAAAFVARVAEILHPHPQAEPMIPEGGIVLTDDDAQQLGYGGLGDWKTQELRNKAVADVMLGLPKRTDQGPAYEEAFDAAKAKVG